MGMGRAVPPNLFPIFPLDYILQEKSMGTFDRGARPRDHLYASELGYCPRAVWMGFKSPKPMDEHFTATRGALGHAIEALMAEKLNGLVVAKEVSFRDDFVSGRVDFVIRMERGGVQIPVELKTTYAYEKFVKSPELSHLLQIGWYLTQMPDAPFGLLVYYALQNKSYDGSKRDISGEWTALQIPRDDKTVTARVATLWEVVHQPKQPKCESPGDCFSCMIHSAQRGAPI